MNDIYVMAHRANTIHHFDEAINAGFNAVEFDVVKHHDGIFYVWHGGAGQGWEHLSEYLDHVATTLLSDTSRLVSLLIVDLKYDKKAGMEPADIAHVMDEVANRVLTPINSAEGVTERTGLFALFTTVFTDDHVGRLEQVITTRGLHDHEGVNFDADYYTNRYRASASWARGWVRSVLGWRNTHVVNNLMLSAGIATGAEIWSNGWRNALRAAADQRGDHVFGTYAWTFHRARGGANSLLRYQLDGVLGNANRRFGRLPRELQRRNLTDHRLVTRADVPPFRRLRRN